MGLIFSSNLPNRASNTVLSNVDILEVNSSVFLRFSSRTERAARDSSKSPTCGRGRRIDILPVSRQSPRGEQRNEGRNMRSLRRGIRQWIGRLERRGHGWGRGRIVCWQWWRKGRHGIKSSKYQIRSNSWDIYVGCTNIGQCPIALCEVAQLWLVPKVDSISNQGSRSSTVRGIDCRSRSQCYAQVSRDGKHIQLLHLTQSDDRYPTQNTPVHSTSPRCQMILTSPRPRSRNPPCNILNHHPHSGSIL
jgi:hypothetical protein